MKQRRSTYDKDYNNQDVRDGMVAHHASLIRALGG